jgi:hypothetical protein
MVRLTRPGGAGAIVAFGPARRVESLGFLLGAWRAVVPDIPQPAMDTLRLPMQLADRERLRRALAEAGLNDIRVRPTFWAWPFA